MRARKNGAERVCRAVDVNDCGCQIQSPLLAKSAFATWLTIVELNGGHSWSGRTGRRGSPRTSATAAEKQAHQLRIESYSPQASLPCIRSSPLFLVDCIADYAGSRGLWSPQYLFAASCGGSSRVGQSATLRSWLRGLKHPVLVQQGRLGGETRRGSRQH